ncbi:hypothetical protein D3C78_1933100 [compost metagenome]
MSLPSPPNILSLPTGASSVVVLPPASADSRSDGLSTTCELSVRPDVYERILSISTRNALLLELLSLRVN